jgi:SAM-dependent methyltransferase
MMRSTWRALPEQRTFWDSWHRKRGASGADKVHVELRELFLRNLPSEPYPCRILDLGCGQGHDVAAMFRAGHRVTGIDFSPDAIRQARRKIPFWRRRQVELRVHDLAEPMPFPDRTFDGAFSHLALHYFHDEATRAIFSEIRRVLRPHGVLVFSVKSVDDPYYGDGERLGENIFNRKGHVRHFFDDAYVKDLLDGWIVDSTHNYRGHYASSRPSAFIRAVARRPA